jgi:hypothetical protein
MLLSPATPAFTPRLLSFATAAAAIKPGKQFVDRRGVAAKERANKLFGSGADLANNTRKNSIHSQREHRRKYEINNDNPGGHGSDWCG